MIFYFSGTGNTRWLARTLSEALQERVFSIADMLRAGDCGEHLHLAEGERIGFCFPVHGWRPPFPVRRFVRSLQLRLQPGESHYVYAFATCGDDVGLTFDYLRQDLQSAGLPLHSAYSVIMPESYMFPLIDTIDRPEQAVLKLRRAREEVVRMLPMIEARQCGVTDVNVSRWPWINSRLLGAFFLHRWVTDRPFRVDPSRCLHCGQCAKACPVGNIACGQDQPPRWLHNGLCTTCFSCYHHCPAHAIEFGGRTRGKRQYYYGKYD